MKARSPRTMAESSALALASVATVAHSPRIAPS